MPADWQIKQGDTQPVFADSLAFSDSSVPPLQGATIVLRLRSLTDDSLTTLAGTTAIDNANTGDISFTPTAADTATPGNYFAEWVVNYAAGTGLGQQTFPTDGYSWVSIEPSLDHLGQQIVSLPAIKKYLNIQGNDRSRDAELLDLVDAIAPLVEAKVGPIIPRLHEEWFDGGSNVITLSYDPSTGFGSCPYLRVVAASEYRGPIEYPLALVPSPAFGSIYSIMVVRDRSSITRRSAGGSTIAFMPGRDSIHVWYESGQKPIPKLIQRAAMEYVRTLYRYPQQTGSGSLSPADRAEAGAMLQHELSRIIGAWTHPMRRFPSIA